MSEGKLNNPNLVEVGKDTRFKSGHSGNPHGRALETTIKEFLSCNDRERIKRLAEELYKSAIGEDVEEVTETELPDGKITRQTKRYREKSVAAFNALATRGFGMPKQEVEVQGSIADSISALFAAKAAEVAQKEDASNG